MSYQHIVAEIVDTCKWKFHTSFLNMSASEKNQWDIAKQILTTKSDMIQINALIFTLGFTFTWHLANYLYFTK